MDYIAIANWAAQNRSWLNARAEEMQIETDDHVLIAARARLQEAGQALLDTLAGLQTYAESVDRFTVKP